MTKRDKKLITDLLGLHQTIYTIGCYGITDMLTYERLWKELERRSYDIETISSIRISKSGEIVS